MPQGEIAQRRSGAVLRSRNGDFAEWRRREPAEAPFEEGDVVGINEAGRLTRRTIGLSQVGVVSRVAMVEGSVPALHELAAFDMVAYAGHVPVKLRGSCQPGNHIVPSGDLSQSSPPRFYLAARSLARSLGMDFFAVLVHRIRGWDSNRVRALTFRAICATGPRNGSGGGRPLQ